MGLWGKNWRFPPLKMSTTADIPANFFGTESYSLDEKGRVTVPFDWRRRDGEMDVFYLVPDTKGECLRAMREDRYAKFGEEVRILSGMTPERHRMFMGEFYSQCVKTTTDKQGRITIPKAYSERFQLKGEIALKATGDLFEIWNKAALKAQQDRVAVEFKHFAGAMGL